MYALTVLGLPADMLGAAPASDASAAALCADVEKVHEACARAKIPIPDDPRAQLRSAIAAVFRSSRSARARIFCEREGLAQDIPTAVVVQAMVFGNMGASSGTGVAFSRNPSTGANEAYGDFLINAQGEDVVSGSQARRSWPCDNTFPMPLANFTASCRSWSGTIATSATSSSRCRKAGCTSCKCVLASARRLRLREWRWRWPARA
jgi:hypothetical protein